RILGSSAANLASGQGGFSVGAGAGGGADCASTSLATLYGARLAFVTVSDSTMSRSICERWLILMPPTATPPNFTDGSQYSVACLPTHSPPLSPQALIITRRMDLHGLCGLPLSPPK